MTVGPTDPPSAPTALPLVVTQAAERFGDRTAYVTPRGWPLSYRDIDRLSDEVAAGLAHRGVGEGDVVALLLPPGPEYLVAYCAIAKLGAITAGVNDRLAPAERTAVLERAAPRLVLAAPGASSGVDAAYDIEVVDPAERRDALLAPLRRPGPPPRLADPDDPERAVAIIFTSGTTGTPKGAVYGNRQLGFITRTDIGDAWDLGGRSFTGTSFATLGFMTKLAGNLRRGGVNFIMERWRAHDSLELLARERMTTVAGVPTQIALMLRDPGFDAFDLSSVQFIVVGGGPVTPGLAEEARARFGARLATRYSCTEAGIGLGTGFDDPDEDAVVSVGRPHPSVEVALRDPADPDRHAASAPGEVGEVCLRSPACMRGYWRDPQRSAEAFTADGFVRTGDLGWIDDAGRLRLVGRSKEMYVRGGYNVHPVEVEAVLSTHPAVAAVAIAPVSDDVMGEIGVAVVVARDRTQPPVLADLRDHARAHLAGYKLPDALVVVDALPLTAAEKIDRSGLAALLADVPADRRHR